MVANPNFIDGDDTFIKGDDGTEDGALITPTTDGSKKRLDTHIADLEEIELRAGNAYLLNIEYSLNNGQTVYQSFKTPNTATRIYLTMKTYSSDRTEIFFYEGPTGVTYSFAWTPANRNRVSSNTSSCTVQAVASQTTTGTFIGKEANYGSGISVSTSPIAQFKTYLLDQNTEYLIGMTSYAATNLTTVQLQWYEVG